MELKTRVEQISDLIRELRQSAGDGRKSRELIDSLFRAVHSFKAAAAAEGQHQISTAAHQFEDLIRALRTGHLPLDKDVLQACEQNAAGLLDGSVISSFDHFTITEIYKTESKPLLPDEFATLRDEERHRAAAALQEGSNLYVLKLVFDVSDFDERFRQMKQRLEKVAELISTSATMEEGEIIVFQVVYASQSEKIPFQIVVHEAICAGATAAAALGKEIQFEMKGDDLLLDKPLADALTDALLHLVRNAVDHGIETKGTVLIEVSEQEVSVTDDGRGIAPENLALIFQPGFSTAPDVTELSGRGVGLDVVKTLVEEFGGSVTVSSEPGKGTSFKIRMPSPSSGA